MRNTELIKKVYEMMRNVEGLSTDQFFDRCQDVIELIERERPNITASEQHRGLEIDEDGTVTGIFDLSN